MNWIAHLARLGFWGAMCALACSCLRAQDRERIDCAKAIYVRVLPNDYERMITKRGIELENKSKQTQFLPNDSGEITLAKEETLDLVIDERELLQTDAEWLDRLPDSRLNGLVWLLVRPSEKALTKLAKKKSLRHLEVACNQIDPALLAEACPPELERLELHPTSHAAMKLNSLFTDEGIQVLAKKLTKLRCLRIQGTRFTDEVYKCIAKMESLEAIEILGANEATDVGLTEIAKLRKVQELSLELTPAMTDEGVLQLLAIPNLSHLMVRGRRLKPETIEKLKAKSPSFQLEVK